MQRLDVDVLEPGDFLQPPPHVLPLLETGELHAERDRLEIRRSPADGAEAGKPRLLPAPFDNTGGHLRRK